MLADPSSDRSVPLELRILRQAQDLAREFAGVFSFETVHQYVRESADSLQNVRISDFVHIFAGRFARERLNALARTQGILKKDTPLILYLCNHNAGRSQLAAAFTTHTDEIVQAADVIVTMGCGDACPVYPGKRYLDWDVADPAGQPLGVVRTIRDDVQGHVEELLAEIVVLEPSKG